MNRDEVRRTLGAYRHGELDAIRQQGVETHLPGCATCKNAAEGITKSVFAPPETGASLQRASGA